MFNKTILLLPLVLLVAGCTLLPSQTVKQETQLPPAEGIGVLEFKSINTRMNPDTYNYIYLTIRNNADGSKAKNIVVSLENLEPFLVYEGGLSHLPSQQRDQSSQFFNDAGFRYRQHSVDSMLPDEEIQFLWNIESPSEQDIAEMSYDHSIYYTLSYDYTSTMTQTIAAMSDAEYLKESKTGPVTLAGQTTSSPGELKLQSTTQQPIIYTEGTPEQAFTLEMQLTNTGDGVISPGSSVIVAVHNDSLTTVNTDLALKMGWANIGMCNTKKSYNYC